MTIEFVMTERELVRGLTLLRRRNRRLVSGTLAAPFMLIVGIVIADAFVIALGVIAVAILAYVWLIVPRRQWRRLPGHTEPWRFTFDAAGIEVVTPTARADVGWNNFAEVFEGDDLYVLRTVNDVCNILPRRAFASPADEERFREIVAAQRGAGVLKP